MGRPGGSDSSVMASCEQEDHIVWTTSVKTVPGLVLRRTRVDSLRPAPGSGRKDHDVIQTSEKVGVEEPVIHLMANEVTLSR